MVEKEVSTDSKGDEAVWTWVLKSDESPAKKEELVTSNEVDSKMEETAEEKSPSSSLGSSARTKRKLMVEDEEEEDEEEKEIKQRMHRRKKPIQSNSTSSTSSTTSSTFQGAEALEADMGQLPLDTSHDQGYLKRNFSADACQTYEQCCNK